MLHKQKEGEIMEFEVLKRSHLKRNIIIGVVVVAIISAVVLNFTRARYRVTESIPIVNGTINYALPDLNITALYIDGVEATELDNSKTYTLDTTNSTCTYKDGSTIENLSISYKSETGNLNIMPFTTKGTKCILYFEEYVQTAGATILVGKDIQTREDFSIVLSTNTNGIIYQETTRDGTTYYFAGDTDENWMSFAGYYWRIIRINEDGSIRMIYNGTSTATTGTNTQLQTTTYNRYSYGDNAGVGYMYGTTGSTSYNSTHANVNSSTIKLTIDSWYKTNIVDKGYSNYISKDAGFCNDRYPSTNYSNSNGLGGTGTTTTFYASLIRLYANDSSSNASPSFNCINNNDLFTVNSSSKGNKALTYPVGLITADEVAYAGGVSYLNNTGYYLYTSQNYWTMTPAIATSYAQVNIVGSAGYIGGSNVANYDITGARPVINLRADVTLTGNGTTSSPYRVS